MKALKSGLTIFNTGLMMRRTYLMSLPTMLRDAN
ncbi:hypothetical protein Pint_35628 [Pistacia integerrima]|uniref:Uncharacterized protein n=1 Tax=Pistacia integerrima TaxID=434235 RepID=A0ACC0Y5A9_9ROSI|nr:hypothetical protein Pint_35628 [Pistacia integerrima]